MWENPKKFRMCSPRGRKRKKWPRDIHEGGVGRCDWLIARMTSYVTYLVLFQVVFSTLNSHPTLHSSTFSKSTFHYLLYLVEISQSFKVQSKNLVLLISPSVSETYKLIISFSLLPQSPGLYLCFRVSELWHSWHFGPDNSLLLGQHLWPLTLGCPAFFSPALMI